MLGINGLMLFRLMTLILPCDYMHNVCLCVVKKLLMLWFDKKHAHMPTSVRNMLNAFNDAMKRLKLPSFITRTPKTFDDLQHWKGTKCECKSQKK